LLTSMHIYLVGILGKVKEIFGSVEPIIIMPKIFYLVEM
jgi:hypothetical protein